jgi:hypothetical protein
MLIERFPLGFHGIRCEHLEYSYSNLVKGRVFHFGIYGSPGSYGTIDSGATKVAVCLRRGTNGDSGIWQQTRVSGRTAPGEECRTGGANFVKEHNPDPPRADDTSSNRKGPSPYPAARRSQRVTIDMPVEIVGQSVNGKAFRQETRTTVVNAHGAQLILAMTIEIQPSVLLRNIKTGAEVQCRVVYQKRVESEKSELGVEFVEPQHRFWGIAFPPEDWSRAERKIPTAHSK